MRKHLLLILIGGLLQSLCAAEIPNQQITEITAGKYVWRLQTPPLNHIAQTSNGLEYPSWNITLNSEGYTVPILSKLIYTRGERPVLESNFGEMRRIESVTIPSNSQERAKGANFLAQPNSEIELNQISTKFIGRTGQYYLWSVNVVGCEYSEAERVWYVPESIEIHISGGLSSSGPAPNELYINQITNDDNQVNSTLSGLGRGRLKLYLLEDGIHRIYYDSLEQIQDYPNENIRSRSITLRNKGEQVPIHVSDGGDGIFDSNDYFDFIGKQNYNENESQWFDPFSDINVYWLDWGADDGLRFIEESGALALPDPVRPTSFWDEVHIEKDSIFDRLGQVDTDLPTINRDHYFWNSVNSGQHEDVRFLLNDPFRGSSENVTISVGLHGLTYSSTPGEEAGHTIFAFLNDYSIGEGGWSQQEEYTMTSPPSLSLSHNILNHGNNKLSIFAPVSTEPGNYDRVVLNWIKVGYEHLLQAHQNKLKFRKSYINPATHLEFEVKGFTSHDLVLYKEGLSKITAYQIRENWEASAPTFSLVFQDQVSDATPDYWVSTVNDLLQPVKIIADTSVSLREQDGDYIIITIPAFTESLDEYVEFKQENGWNPVVVSIADIYDEFNYGINSPYAIRSFLDHALNFWPSSPKHAILIGDAIADPQATKRDTRIQNVPTFYMQTHGWGAAEADYWFSLLNGDDYLPDMNIGRLPVSDSNDLEIVLQKLIRYGGKENYGAWQNEIIAIAGFESTFKSQSESLLKQTIPKTFLPSRIFIDRDSEGQIFWGDTDSLVQQWNDGKLLINFLGHGGGAVWADRSLFVRDDIQYLDPSTPPAFVTSMTCFTASFSQIRGLGEVVLTESPAGAIGWFGSSGVGWVINDYLMIQPLLRRLLEEDKTVGELINIARMEYFLANSGYDYLKPSMLFQYNYLGDPTTRLNIPQKADLLSSGKSIYAPDEQINLSYTGDEAGMLKILPINADGLPWQAQPSIYETEHTQQFLFNQADSASWGESRSIYTLDRGPFSSALHGYLPYSILEDWFEHYPLTAAEIAGNIIPDFKVTFHSSDAILDSVVLQVSSNTTQNLPLLKVANSWLLLDTLNIVRGSGTVNYRFMAYSADEVLQVSPSYRLYLPEDISLSLNDLREGTQGSLCGWILDYSLSGQASGTAHLDHAESSDRYNQTISKMITLYEGNNSYFIPSFLGIDAVNITSSLRLSGDVNVGDNSLQKNIIPSYKMIIPGIGITYDGITEDSLIVWSTSVMHGGSNDTAWFKIDVFDEVLISGNGLTFYRDTLAYSLDISNPSVHFDIKAPKSLFLQRESLPNWSKLNSSGSLYQVNASGVIAMAVQEDFTGPDVSMMIEGQLFFDGDYLLADSRLNLLAEDENGFTWDPQDVQILLDDSPLNLELGDTTEQGKIMSVIADLNLSIGPHSVSYRVKDALGNWSAEASFEGVVAADAEIIDYGNFPNPFQGETLIIYELTQPLDEVEIEIFTLAGYKLHVIDSFNGKVSISLGAIGYHEVPWNGRNRIEEFVANGIYFYRIKGNLEGETIVGPVGKMVKNR